MSIREDLSPQEYAHSLYSSGEYEPAAQAFRDVIAHDPTNGLAWKGLGLCLIQLGDKTGAVEACQKAAQLQIGNAECRYAYGYALGAEGRYGEAIQELDASLVLQPNHLPAKQALIYAIVQHGEKLQDEDPRLAENYLDRALKLDGRNPNVVAPYLNHLLKTGQKGKAAGALYHIDEEVKKDPKVAAVIEKMHADTAFHAVIHQAEMSKPAHAVVKAPAAVAAPAAIQTIPCPNCRQPIADYAAICPHCDFRLRATGTFAGRDTGPAYEWQEIALTIISVLWIANAGYMVYAAMQMEFAMIRDIFLTVAIVNAALGIGMLFRVEWIMTIAKIFAYLNLLQAGWGIMLHGGLGHWGDAAAAFFQLTMAGFLIYLIGYTSDA